jgi:hypothetical protein
MPRWILLVVAIVVALPCGVGVSGAGERPVYGVRVDGQRVTALGGPGTKAVALFFVASDCPISNRTFPEMKRVREEFAGRGVRFWFVYPNEGEKAAEVKAHQEAYDSGGEAMLDVSGGMVRMAGAKVTPEVSVLVPEGNGWRVVYTGRVDDRYVRIGLERPAATEHFAERALTSVLAGTPVEAATGEPVGCGIVSAGASKAR